MAVMRRMSWEGNVMTGRLSEYGNGSFIIARFFSYSSHLSDVYMT